MDDFVRWFKMIELLFKLVINLDCKLVLVMELLLELVWIKEFWKFVKFESNGLLIDLEFK